MLTLLINTEHQVQLKLMVMLLLVLVFDLIMALDENSGGLKSDYHSASGKKIMFVPNFMIFNAVATVFRSNYFSTKQMHTRVARM